MQPLVLVAMPERFVEYDRYTLSTPAELLAVILCHNRIVKFTQPGKKRYSERFSTHAAIIGDSTNPNNLPAGSPHSFDQEANRPTLIDHVLNNQNAAAPHNSVESSIKNEPCKPPIRVIHLLSPYRINMRHRHFAHELERRKVCKWDRPKSWRNNNLRLEIASFGERRSELPSEMPKQPRIRQNWIDVAIAAQMFAADAYKVARNARGVLGIFIQATTRPQNLTCVQPLQLPSLVWQGHYNSNKATSFFCDSGAVVFVFCELYCVFYFCLSRSQSCLHL